MLVMSREPSRHLRDPLIQLVNDFTPDLSMLAILAELKQRGYTILLFSNIGETCFAALRQKHPEVFVSFTDFHCSQRVENYTKKPGTRHTSAAFLFFRFSVFFNWYKYKLTRSSR